MILWHKSSLTKQLAIEEKLARVVACKAVTSNDDTKWGRMTYKKDHLVCDPLTNPCLACHCNSLHIQIVALYCQKNDVVDR